MKLLQVSVDGRIHGYADNTPVGRREVERYLGSIPWRSAYVSPTQRLTQGAERIDR